jgi:hypothetical protein
MKTLLIIFYTVIIISPAISQINWLTRGAKWTYDFSSYGGYGLTKLEVTNEDTLLGNHIYKKLLSNTIYVNTGMINSPLDTFIETSYAYEENNVIYGYEPNLFPWVYIIYDFNRTIGDTLDFMFFGGLSPSPFVVDSVGTLDINGSIFAFQDIKFPDFYDPGQFFKMRVLQGLGSIDSYFFHTHTILQPFDAPSYHLRCYEDSNVGLINLSYNQVDCDYIEGVTSIAEATKAKVSVFPNPSKDEIEIDIGNKIFDEIELFDFKGIKLKSYQTNPINISDLDNGIYFIRVIDSNKESYITKVLKTSS